MKSVPRVFVDMPLKAGANLPLMPDQAHYLTRVMRADKFLAFNDGAEFECRAGRDRFKVVKATGRADPSGEWTMYFAPIKKTEDLVSAVVQLGAGRLVPIITERTVARNVNWGRVRRVIIEATEQSGRNSLPELAPPVKFDEVDWKGVVFGDERQTKVESGVLRVELKQAGKSQLSTLNTPLLVGPEGGFSEGEFKALDMAGAVGVSLGATILRAEVAAVALAAKYAGGG